MNQEYFRHPNRFPGNVAGPFYTTGSPCVGGSPFDGMLADCLQCEAPENEAPDLLHKLDDIDLNTYFTSQPSTLDEVERACNAIRVCCVCALRYGGQDRDIIRKLGNSPEHSDFIIDTESELRLTVNSEGTLLPFAQAIVDEIIERRLKSDQSCGSGTETEPVDQRDLSD